MQPRVHIKMGSNNLQGESTMWTYCVRIFSLSLCALQRNALPCELKPIAYCGMCALSV